MNSVTILLLSFLSGPLSAATGFVLLDDTWQSPANCDEIREPIRIMELDPFTFILRESPCVDREAPFMYLLIGSEQALLVDSGTQDGVLLVEIVGRKLTEKGLEFAELTVAHTHSHLDHRSGDGALAAAGARVVGSTAEEVREFWNLDSWPEGVATLDFGDRLIEVLPIPGHNDNSIVLFDHRTRILLSGDSMMRGKIVVNDLSAFRKSVVRLSRFIDDVTPRAVLGGHLERPDVPLGLPPVVVTELVELSKRMSFVHSIVRGKPFTLVYLRPILGAMGVGFLLLLGGLLRRLVSRVKRKQQPEQLVSAAEQVAQR